MPTGETFTKDKDIQEIISDAVGLSFEQFSRMAMLAQGQFASFLTGDKKERESILEKLTFTEHFSEYGEAINRLFKKAEDQKKDAQKSHDTIEKLLLKEADLEKYNNDLLEFNTKKGKKENEKKGARNVEIDRIGGDHTKNRRNRAVAGVSKGARQTG